MDTTLLTRSTEPTGSVPLTAAMLVPSMQAAAALQHSEALFRATFEQAAVGIAHVAPDGRWLRVNQRLCAILGYSEAELLTKTFQELTHPDDLLADLAQVAQMLAGEIQTYSMRKRYWHKHSHLVWANLTVSLIRDCTGATNYFVSMVEDITPLKQAEDALRAKMAEEYAFQQYLRTLHEITIELTAIEQVDTFYRRVIELGLERLGFERLGLLFYDHEQELAVGTYGTDAQGRVVAEHHLRLSPASLTGILQRALDSPEHFAFDTHAPLFSNGEPIGVGWNAVAVLWNDQQGLGWLAADNGVHHQPVSKPLLDVLALYSSTIATLLRRKQLEAALRKSEEKFRLLVEAAPLAILISDCAGQITLVNHRAELLFGYPRTHLIGQSVDLLVPAAVRTRHADNRATYMAEPRVRPMGMGQELYARHQDGHEFPVEIELSYAETPAGLIIMSFILDISDRKRAAGVVREQRDFLQLIIDHVPALITVNDRTGYFHMGNKSAAQIYGLTAAEMVGKTDAEVNPNPAEVAFFLQTDQAALESAQPVFIPEQTILGRYYQTSKFPLKNSTGSPDRLLVISTDITQRKATEVGLQQTLAKEKELSELKSRFVSMASHEFRTPLAAILVLTETLSAYRHKLTDEQIMQRLGKIQEQVGHLKEIMDDMLELACMQARRTEFKSDWLALDAFCRLIIEEFQSGPALTHHLLYTSDETLPSAKVDKRLLRQIISNLISNAIKYSPADKAVAVSLAQSGETLRLQVRDEGIGIPEADLKHLFQPFHRATNVGTIAGTGLGLVIAKEAVELHKGTITVESQVSVGTTVTVILPIATKAADALAESSAAST